MQSKNQRLVSQIFSCDAFEFNQTSNIFSSASAFHLLLQKISTVSNRFLQVINVASKKVWSGNQFFGFNRKYVRILLNNELISNIPNSHFVKPAVPPVSLPNNEIIGDSIYTWLGVVNLGRRVTGELRKIFHYTAENNVIFLPDGFVSRVCIKNENDKQNIVSCSIQANGSIPTFSCVVDDRTFQSNFPSAAVKDLLIYLNCPKPKLVRV